MIVAKAKPGDLWWIAGLVGLIAGVFIAMVFASRANPNAQIEMRSKQLELLDEARIALAAASEAQNGAVMSTVDEDTKSFINQARIAGEDFARSLTQLETLLKSDGERKKLELLDQVQKAYMTFEALDRKLSELATQNTNRKAYVLAYGPVTDLLRKLDEALAQIVEEYDATDPVEKLRVSQMANNARIAILRTQVLLLPHIAEERDDKMAEFELLLSVEDKKVHENLDALASGLQAESVSQIENIRELYANFMSLKNEIIKLSRENTNVRSSSLALTEKRHALLAVQDSLAALEKFIKSEPIRSPIPQGR